MSAVHTLAARLRAQSLDARRRDVALDLEHALEDVTYIHDLWHDADTCHCPDELERARPDLAAVIERLRAPAPVAAVGVARVRSMLAHTPRLLYRSTEPGALQAWAQEVLRELEP